MTVATFQQPDYTGQSGTAYPLAIDAAIAVLARLGTAFAPHAQATPDMTVVVDAGAVFDGATLTEVAAQTTAALVAPAANPRIDRLVIDRATGAVSVVAGTEAAAPTAPAIPAGALPVAQVALAVGMSAIANSAIADERNLHLLGLGTAAQHDAGSAAGQVLLLDGAGAIPAAVGGLFPAGALAYHAASTPPAGWLVRDGSAISRTTYAALFGVIGTTYGAGDGSTSFNLPDDRGEFPRGWDGGRGVDSGRVFGSWQADDFKSHTHLAGPLQQVSADGGSNARNWNITSATAGTSSATGGSETRPRNRAYLPIIKY